jgi:hypothetical protein
MPYPPTVLPDNIVVSPAPMWENTAKVVAPDAASCPNGKVVLQTGQPRSEAGLLQRDLLDASGAIAATATTEYTHYPIDTTISVNATDNQLIRLPDHSLLAVKNGYIWSDLPNPPAWFGAAEVECDNPQGGPNGTSPQGRNIIFVFRSKDNGVTWKLRGSIDSATHNSGKYSWPQPLKDDSGVQYGWGVGGYDRCDACADPWSDAIYISAHASGGPFTLDGTEHYSVSGVVFRSTDHGKSWSLHHHLDHSGQSPTAGHYPRTTTPLHRLVVLTVVDGDPCIAYEENGSLTAWTPVPGSAGGVTYKASGDTSELSTVAYGCQWCMARAGTANGADRVRIAYSSLNEHGRAVIVVCVVSLDGGGAATVQATDVIEAVDPQNQSCILGAFVEDDLVDPATPGTDSLFYWAETPLASASTQQLRMRYKLYTADVTYGPGDLSVAGGQPRSFPTVGQGDYYSGGIFPLNGRVNFLAQWVEPDGIKGNVVSYVPAIHTLHIWEAAIDPLALILSETLYELLHRPDPERGSTWTLAEIRERVGAALREEPRETQAQILHHPAARRSWVATMAEELERRGARDIEVGGVAAEAERSVERTTPA